MDRRHDMSMGMSSNSWTDTNTGLAAAFWYLIAGTLGLCLVFRVIDHLQNRLRLKTLRSRSVAYPTRPQNVWIQAWATITAVAREASYPQLYIPIRGFQWLSPPPLGRVLLLFAYWAVVIYIMASDVVLKDVLFWERIGYRNAWASVMQVPLLYMLALKTNLVGLISGTSYERLNWLHRWVARTLFVTATVHGWHFYQEWVIADIVEWQLETMPMVVYGIGAWAILLWFFITSLKPFRSMAYEVFVVQHIIGAVLFLWLLYVHLPQDAQYNVWFAVALLVLDRVFRGGMFLWQNTKLNPVRSRCSGGQRWGHQVQLAVAGDATTIVTIKDVHFTWRPGQHLWLWLPRVGLIDTHPYTIACPHRMPKTCICNSIQLVIRAHSGFSRRLHQHARKLADKGDRNTLMGFVIGPFGNPPRWDVYETLVLISASTGASFTLPILENLLKVAETQQDSTICTKRVDFLLAARQGEELGFYVERLREAAHQARVVGIELNVHVAVTGKDALNNSSIMTSLSTATDTKSHKTNYSDDNDEKDSAATRPAVASCCKHSRTDSSSSESDELTPALRTRSNSMSSNKKNNNHDISSTASAAAAAVSGSSSCCHDSSSSPQTNKTRDDKDADAAVQITTSTTRPDIKNFIRAAVEATGGETGVVVCGGTPLVSATRNSVARLSDERAVHKGTGAQGIFLFVEEYCF